MNWRQYLSRLNESQQNDTPLLHWGLLSVAVILFYTLLLEPYLTWESERDFYLNAEMKKVSKMLALKEVEPEWSKSLVDIEAQKVLSMQRLMFAAQTRSSTQGALQALVKKSAKDYKLKVIKLDFAGDAKVSNDKAYGEISFSIRLNGSIKGQLEFMHAMAAHEKLIVISHWHLKRDYMSHSSATLIMRAFYRRVTDGD